MFVNELFFALSKIEDLCYTYSECENGSSMPGSEGRMFKDYFGKDASGLLEKKLFLLDMDGTIYEDERVFDGTVELLNEIEKQGGRYMFLTNNSSRSVDDYVAKINRLHIPGDRDSFFTSVDATDLYLKEHYPGALIYVQGTKSLVKGLADKGLRVTEEEDPAADVVLVGFDTELTFEKLTRTCRMLRVKERPYIATNPDYVCPVAGGFVPDCGSMCISIRYATGRMPKFIGKPEPTMVDIVRTNLGFTKKDTVLIGDRLYTDIASGVNAGVDTILVLSGEATLKDLEESEVKPAFVLQDVKVLYQGMVGRLS